MSILHSAPLWKWHIAEAAAKRTISAPWSLCLGQRTQTIELRHSFSFWVVPRMHLSKSFASLIVMNVGLKSSRNTSGKQSPSAVTITPRIVFSRTEPVLFSRILMFHTMVKNGYNVFFFYHGVSGNINFPVCGSQLLQSILRYCQAVMFFMFFFNFLFLYQWAFRAPQLVFHIQIFLCPCF